MLALSKLSIACPLVSPLVIHMASQPDDVILPSSGMLYLLFCYECLICCRVALVLMKLLLQMADGSLHYQQESLFILCIHVWSRLICSPGGLIAEGEFSDVFATSGWDPTETELICP